MIIVKLRPNRRFYRTASRLIFLYGMKSRVIKRYHAQKMSVVEIYILRWMYGIIRRDNMRNKDILDKLYIAPKKKFRENCI